MNFLENLLIKWENSKYIPTVEQEECEHEWHHIGYPHHGHKLYCPKCKLERTFSSEEYFKINADKRYKEKLVEQEKYEKMPGRLLEGYEKIGGSYVYEDKQYQRH